LGLLQQVAECPGNLAGLPIQQRRPLRYIQTWIPQDGASITAATSCEKSDWRYFTVLGSYGFVKNITTSTIIGSDQGNVHWRYYDIWAGPAEISPVHRFVAAWSYQLPFGKGKTYAMTGVMDGVFGGWYVSGITDFSTGSNRTVTTGDNTGSGLKYLDVIAQALKMSGAASPADRQIGGIIGPY
jgi:hypothetical protein